MVSWYGSPSLAHRDIHALATDCALKASSAARPKRQFVRFSGLRPGQHSESRQSKLRRPIFIIKRSASVGEHHGPKGLHVGGGGGVAPLVCPPGRARSGQDRKNLATLGEGAGFGAWADRRLRAARPKNAQRVQKMQ